MENCKGCGGHCENCGGCGKELTLSPEEIALLRELGQYSFLPVARKPGDMIPVYLEAGQEKQAEMSMTIQCLEKKMLIDLDYTPLPGADMRAYKGYPVHGSMALTERGQQVLELLEVQGYRE